MSYYPAPLSRRRRRGGIWSPANLFAAGEQGFWYDPSDLTTLFQDAAGVTPVTAVEQPVRLMLDKSKGLVLGSELVTNGDFSGGLTDWFVGVASSATVASGEAEVTFGGALTSTSGNWFAAGSQIVPSGDSKFFAVEFDATWVSGGSLQVGAAFTLNRTIAPNAGKTRYRLFTSRLNSAPGGNGYPVTFGSNIAGSVWRIDNVTARELAGNHATASADARRPVLSARVNELTYTRDFSLDWTKTGCATTATATDLPTGDVLYALTPNVGVTAAFLARTVTTGVPVFISFYARAREYTTIRFRDGGTTVLSSFDLSTGAVTNAGGATGTMTAVGGGTYRCTITYTPASTTFRMHVGDTTIPAANGTDAVLVGSMMQTTGAGDHGAYQWINAATNYDTTNFPRYLRFDGTDDCLLTGNINFTATDKVTVCAGVRKLSDAAGGWVLEHGTSGTAYSFVLAAPDGAAANYRFYSRASISGGGVSATATPLAAPTTNVVTGVGNIAASFASIAVNGGAASTGSGSQVGVYGTYQLYIGARADTSLRFNGRLYALIGRGALSDAVDLANTEAYVNNRTRAY